MYIKTNLNQLLITFQYNPIIVSVVTKFEGRSFDNKTKTWFVPNIHVIKVVDTLTPLGFKADSEVLEIYNKRIEKNKNIELSLEKTPNKKIQELDLPLFDFQKKGVSFLNEIGSGILGDEPGLGKTLQSLAVTLLNKSQKNLIVCPASLKLQWEEEIFKWVKDTKVYVVSGTKKQRDIIYNKALKEKKVFYLIINYELVLRDVEILKRF